MPQTFTPKFVDLVRNATSVTGTGPVTLGAAVSGFTGFAAATAAGEQFYYCIQGIDKPQEREVGRGTMQANGTIAREAVSGALTSFTSGAKTISLVAAAEWFSRLDLLTPGGSAGAASVASRAALAALPVAGAGPIYLTEARRGGLFLFDPSNLSAKVAADTAQGVFVAPSSAPSGASGAWVRQYSGPIQFDWFGAVAGDYASGVSPDCLPAWAALNSYLDATNRNVSVPGQGASAQILFPGAQYYFSDTIQVKRTLRLTGMGVGSPGGEPTWLRFAADKAGIVVNRANTIGDALQTTATTGGDGVLIEGFLLQGGAGTASGVVATDLLYSGIRLRARATIRDCFVRNFRGAGICISANIGDGTDPYHGNANNWRIDTVRLESNRIGGLYVSGGDANAGTAIAVDCSYNGRFGIYDAAFLGNTYIGCHTDHNGVLSNFGSETSLVYHAGNIYHLAKGVSTATARATTPGTNAAVWRSDGAWGGAGGDFPQWTSSGNYVPGGSYAVDGTANGCVLLGCYHETGQGLPQVGQAAVVIGGFMLDGSDDGGAHLHGGGNGLQSQRAFMQAKTFADGSRARHSLGGDMSGSTLELLTWNSSEATSLYDPDRKGALVQEKATGDICWRDTNSGRPLRLTGPNTGRTYGGRSQAECRFIVEVDQLALGHGNGNGNAARIMAFGSAPPGSGYHALGEIVWNSGELTGVATIDHWRCTVAGTPGTWVAVGLRSNSAAFGYTSGAGAAVVQTGAKDQTVTINKVTGRITMHGALLAAGAVVSFAANNNLIQADDTVIVNIASGATVGGYMLCVSEVDGGAGRFRVSIKNETAGALAEAIVLNFAVLKGSAS